MKHLNVLVVDNEDVICDACRLVLGEKGHRVHLCKTGKSGAWTLERESWDLLLLDMKLPDMDGMQILQGLKDRKARPRVIVMTGYSTLANAVQAMKLGAVDYLCKPFTDDELMHAVEKAFAEA